MKRILIILGVIIFALSTVLATEQIPDKLIIGNDTIFLKSFPLEELKVNGEFIKSPFSYGKYWFPHTACWRGYIATWEVIDDLLFLKEVRKLDSVGTQLDIVEYLENNGYNPKIINGFVQADWYSDALIAYDLFYDTYSPEKFYIVKDYIRNRNKKKIELVFENGRLILNNITPIEDYKIGDTLCFDVSYYRTNIGWFFGKSKNTQIEGIIRANDGEMVWFEVVSLGTDKKDDIPIIKEKIKKLDNSWINPRYYRRKE
ncbi:MAG: hypothetical protein FWH59_04430 [Lentimicrobiaceae bacterium]|nr:hypothetical protein [Lentimicrobiaceae bacterium]